MKRIGSYGFFIVIYFLFTQIVSLDGYITNSIATCISTIALYVVFGKIKLTEFLLLLLTFTIFVPALILILIGGGD